jgi:hypothetical protein
MTLGVAQRVYAVEAAKLYPHDPAAAQHHLAGDVAPCGEPVLAAPFLVFSF